MALRAYVATRVAQKMILDACADNMKIKELTCKDVLKLSKLRLVWYVGKQAQNNEE